ncbi:CBS domain-containing protein [Bacillus capparidis]|uniref:CBS domain-containing protein n=1 Tax=Bacillus capparidis TaxID=1840411 RepID=A0ABS4D0V3_9BACI|nr:CBS domain-containing protein [Bacillus capparidis]
MENDKLVGIVSLGDLAVAVSNQSNKKVGAALENIPVPAEPNK